MGILVDPEADHDTERNGELLKSDESATDLTIMTVSKHVISNQWFGIDCTYGGAHSELYRGTIMDRLPTPIPLSRG